MIEFKEINQDNFYDVINMKLPTGTYCAQNVYSLAEAWLYGENAKPYAIYDDHKLVGFIMFDVDYDERELGIWRMMFAPEHQNKGLGYETMKKIISEYSKCQKFDYIYLFCSPQNKPALHLYKKVGFYETGEIEEDEIVMRYDFK